MPKIDVRTKVETPAQQTPSQPVTTQKAGIDYFNSVVAQLRNQLGPLNAGTVLAGDESGKMESMTPIQLDDTAPEEIQKEREAELNRPMKLPEPNKSLKIPTPVHYENLPPGRWEATVGAIEKAQAKLRQSGLNASSFTTGKGEIIDQEESEPIPTPRSKVTQPKLKPKDTLPPAPPPAPEPIKPKVVSNPGLPEEFATGPNFFEAVNRSFAAQSQKTEQKEDTPSEPPKEVEETPSAGALAKKTHCEHCGWDQSIPDPETPDDIDKLNFMQAILGQIPFKKSYQLLDGKVIAVFRSLNSEEANMTFTQVAFDAGKGAILDEGQYFRTLNDYRLCLSLNTLILGEKTYNLPDDISEWDTDPVPPKATKLMHIVPYIYNEVLKSEPLRRAVAMCFFRFQRLVEHIEGHFDDPNFWQAIERPY